jgi:outer membrane murein-binding lipoprotein Lpp
MPGISKRGYILASTALALGLLTAGPARAQSGSSINSIESQIKALQRELQELKRQIQAKESAVRAARQDAQAAKESAAAGQPPLMVITAPPPVADIPGPTSGSTPAGGPIKPFNPQGSFQLGGVTVQLGGFLAAEAVFRTKGIVSDLTSSFNAYPFGNTALGHEAETRFSSRQSRLSLMAFGDPVANVRLTGYAEFDFLSAAGTANYTESNSWNPRVRHLFASVDDDDAFGPGTGLHFLAGQTWSLVTPFKVGLVPRNEQIPLTIDPQYQVGFTWARQAQFRLTADAWDHKLWAAISAENPQTSFTTGGFTAATAGSVITLPTGYSANIANAGTSVDGNGVNYSFNNIPDFVGKVAVDPGFGHYEAMGLVRVMTDRIDALGKHNYNSNSVAGGGGASANIPVPVVPHLELTGEFLAGQGIGRYGTSQLPDATLKPNGTISPIPEVQAMVGPIYHPAPNVDLWALGGTEQAMQDSFTYAGKGFGYGNSTFVNTGCNTELSTLTCSANTRSIWETSFGAWWRPYKGNYGTLQAGAQYSHLWRYTFAGVGGAPKQDVDLVFFSFRYYPFQ